MRAYDSRTLTLMIPKPRINLDDFSGGENERLSMKWIFYNKKYLYKSIENTPIFLSCK